jgi:hypothetical protein
LKSRALTSSVSVQCSGGQRRNTCPGFCTSRFHAHEKMHWRRSGLTKSQKPKS